MTNANYRKNITVASDRETAFDAVTHGVEQWWTRPDKPLREIGGRAKFTFPPGKSYWTFELTKTDKPTRVEWRCVDALHLHEGQPDEIRTEWLGTSVVWEISETSQGTTIAIEHVGLTPQLLCYDICEAGWDFFFLESLKQYLDTGKGSPHQG
ncbi:MAG: SRPBCC domain-containing protein [Pseudomonadota bacterium]